MAIEQLLQQVQCIHRTFGIVPCLRLYDLSQYREKGGNIASYNKAFAVFF